MKLLADLTPLRESPPFRRLWVGTTLSSVGGAMATFAITLQVWDITRSTVAVGLLALATLVPLLAVGLSRRGADRRASTPGGWCSAAPAP